MKFLIEQFSRKKLFSFKSERDDWFTTQELYGFLKIPDEKKPNERIGIGTVAPQAAFCIGSMDPFCIGSMDPTVSVSHSSRRHNLIDNVSPLLPLDHIRKWQRHVVSEFSTIESDLADLRFFTPPASQTVSYNNLRRLTCDTFV